MVMYLTRWFDHWAKLRKVQCDAQDEVSPT